MNVQIVFPQNECANIYSLKPLEQRQQDYQTRWLSHFHLVGGGIQEERQHCNLKADIYDKGLGVSGIYGDQFFSHLKTECEYTLSTVFYLNNIFFHS